MTGAATTVGRRRLGAAGAAAVGGAAVAAVALWWVVPVAAVAAALTVAAAAATALAVWDWYTHRLPNRATAAFAVAGLIAAGVLAAVGEVASAWPAVGGLVVFGAVGVLEALPRDALGGGDAKLLAASGAWTGLLGWSALFPTLLCAHLVMLAVLVVSRIRGAGRRVVMGPAITAGVVVGWIVVGLAA